MRDPVHHRPEHSDREPQRWSKNIWAFNIASISCAVCLAIVFFASQQVRDPETLWMYAGITGSMLLGTAFAAIAALFSLASIATTRQVRRVGPPATSLALLLAWIAAIALH